jgi:hypothetical protein
MDERSITCSRATSLWPSLTITGDSVRPALPQELFVLPVSETPVSPFDVAKGGRFLVRADVQQGSRPLSAIVNWQTLIK